ncbi:hypothetical protein [Thiolapillus sp.]
MKKTTTALAMIAFLFALGTGITLAEEHADEASSTRNWPLNTEKWGMPTS